MNEFGGEPLYTQPLPGGASGTDYGDPPEFHPSSYRGGVGWLGRPLPMSEIYLGRHAVTWPKGPGLDRRPIGVRIIFLGGRAGLQFAVFY